MRNTRFIISAIFLSLGLALTAASAHASNHHTRHTQKTRVTKTTTQKTKAQFLFIQTAQAGELQAIKNKSGVYSLTMANVNPYIMYFTDRPHRMTGLTPTMTFLKTWRKGRDNLQKNPPNVGLEAIVKDPLEGKKTLSIVLTLTNPVYNQETDTMTYVAHTIPNTPTLADSTKLRNIALFIDGAAGRICADCDPF